MAGVLTGLSSLGLEHLNNQEIFSEEEDLVELEKREGLSKTHEVELIYDKKIVCPVCKKSFINKTMKSGKAKLLATEWDLRPVYEGIDANKYGVCQCTFCGYATLVNSFEQITDTQKKNVEKLICKSVLLTPYIDDIYSYEDAIERYKLALATSVVKKVKNSERAYICVKMAWLYRGFYEYLEAEGEKEAAMDAKKQEFNYIQNAYKGFVMARSTEDYPMCGMDAETVDYMIAALAVHMKKYDIAEKLLSGLLTSAETNKRMKEKARELKEIIKEKRQK